MDARVCAAIVIALSGCGPQMEWRPSDPSKEYPAEQRTASRVDSAPCDAEKIGVVHASGNPSEVIEAIARAAADHGGTSYVVRGDDHTEEFVGHSSSTRMGGTTFTSARGHVERTEYVWAVVYRGGGACPSESSHARPAPVGPDLTQCSHAFTRWQDMADAWLGVHGGDARDEPPTRERFLEVCAALPEAMQLCLNPPYAASHKDQCDDAYAALGPQRKKSVSRLFAK